METAFGLSSIIIYIVLIILIYQYILAPGLATYIERFQGLNDQNCIDNYFDMIVCICVYLTANNI